MTLKEEEPLRMVSCAQEECQGVDNPLKSSSSCLIYRYITTPTHPKKKQKMDLKNAQITTKMWDLFGDLLAEKGS